MSQKIPKTAFTTKYDGLVSELVQDVQISEAFHPSSGAQPPQRRHAKAIWDTGATESAISKEVVADLGLQPIDRRQTHTANGTRIADVYLVNVYLPNRVAFSGVRVSDADIHGCDVLVGMDIIGSGDFAVTHRHGKTWMTFQVPSTHATDYVHEIDVENGKKGFRKKPSKKGGRRPKRKN